MRRRAEPSPLHSALSLQPLQVRPGTTSRMLPWRPWWLGVAYALAASSSRASSKGPTALASRLSTRSSHELAKLKPAPVDSVVSRKLGRTLGRLGGHVMRR
jgi:hypothetical protein